MAGLSGGLKLGDASSSGALFKGANLSFSNNSNIAPSSGLKLNGDQKLDNLPLLPATTATVSKETASGVRRVHSRAVLWALKNHWALIWACLNQV